MAYLGIRGRMKAIAVAPRALITGRYPIEAHRELLLGQATGIKNVINFER